jgi:hypothetical protein
MIIGQILLGLIFIGVAVAFIAVTLSATTARKAYWICAVCIAFTDLFTICALAGELTGKAVYHKKGQPDESVTRESSPDHFQSAMNNLWTLAAISSVIAAGGFVVSRFSSRPD